MPSIDQQHRKIYDEEFKRTAVAFYHEQGVSLAQAAKNFNVTSGMLSKWVKKYSQPSDISEAGGATTDEQEVKKLREEVRAMRADIGTLKQIMRKTLLARTLD